MSIGLIVECLDHAPTGLGRSERLVLIALAEKADDVTRRVRWNRGENPQDTLRRRTGLSTSGLREAFQRLAAAGLEVRVQRGTDSRGRPVFAHEGAVVEYALPRLASGDGIPSPPVDNSSQWRRDAVTTEASEVTVLSACGDGEPLPPQARVVTESRRPSPSVPHDPSTRTSGGGSADAPVVDEGGHSADPPSSDPDAGAVSDHAEAATALVARLGAEVTAQQARDCVAAVVRRKRPDDVARYTSRFSAADVARWASDTKGARAKAAGPARQRCSNGALVADDGTCCYEHATTAVHGLEASA